MELSVNGRGTTSSINTSLHSRISNCIKNSMILNLLIGMFSSLCS